MGKYASLAQEIVKNVGGKENINSLNHCITRLRFRLKDESIANDDYLKNLDGVITVMKSGGQYQVVIGNHVPKVYEEVMEAAGLSDGFSSSDSDAPQGIFNKLLDVLSGSFQPFLGVMAASGMIKGVITLLVSFKIMDANSDTYTMLYNVGDAIFYFMPIMLAYTASKKFKLNPILGMTIGMAMLMPALQKTALSAGGDAAIIFEGTFMQGDSFSTIFGFIPVIAYNYASSVVPILFVIAFAAQVQKLMEKIIPEIIQNFLVPFFVLLIAVPVGYIAIGPVISALTNIFQSVLMAIMAFSPVVYGVVLGALWQVLVIFGLHWSIIPISIMQVTELGYSQVLTPMFTTTFAQTAVVVAMMMKTKSKEKKSLGIPAVISGFAGITEPAIYGFSLPAVKPFVYSCIAAAVGGGMMMSFDLIAYRSGGLGIFGVLNYITQDGDPTGLWLSLIAVAVSVVIAFVLTYFFWKEEEVEEVEVVKTDLVNDVILSPMEGQVIKTSELTDDTFRSGLLGTGVGIIPTSGTVVSPVDGTVTALFPTLHAIGLTSDSGVEMLIHIGQDTVQLEGEGFEAFVKQNDRVKKGQKLVEVDLKFVESKGYSLQTPVIITNSKDLLDIIETEKTQIHAGDELFTVIF